MEDPVSEMFTVWNITAMDKNCKHSNQSYNIQSLTSELQIYSKTRVTSTENALCTIWFRNTLDQECARGWYLP
jgi:hypothetical protein